ncbi:bifunctional folylpolyglutamate synthase/dihydrofolate synthase, partial [uncultured Leuconostoc sp.]|uniref:bifunctional folylpolyglutamate synthase/dihydrofolate synthase n=1 Tax=uncultured Leuconostoc sp. TaxID=173262 RepID=UPI0025E789D6
AMMGAVLQANGYSYGRFSSPSILSAREQICVDDEMISKIDFVNYYERVIKCFKFNGVSANYLTYFEYFTIISLLYFVDHQVDFVLFEAGLGGLRDATNAIDTPLLTVFTKISIDHQNLIGRNLTEIAENKAAIIKKGTWVIDYAGQDLTARKVLKSKTEVVGAKWFEYQQDQIIIANTTPSGMDLIINGTPGYFLSMSGAFQVHNFSIVLQIKAALNDMGYTFVQDKTRKGLANVNLVGRMNYHQASNILFDAAHNVDGINGLVSALNAWHLKIKPTLILGVLKDKDYHEMLDTIVPVVQRIITVTPNNKTRALSAEELAAELLTNYQNIDVEIANDASAAISLAMRVRESSQALIVVTGSFYTLSAIKKDHRMA